MKLILGLVIILSSGVAFAEDARDIAERTINSLSEGNPAMFCLDAEDNKSISEKYASITSKVKKASQSVPKFVTQSSVSPGRVTGNYTICVFYN